MALQALTSSNRTVCGADKDVRTLTVETATQTVTYGDDFYACQNLYAQYATTDSLDRLYTAVSVLVR